MDDIKDIVIDDMKFQLNKLDALSALKLEKKIMAVASPVVSSLMEMGSKNLDMKMDFDTIGLAFSKALESLSDEEYEKILVDSLSKIVYLGEGKPAQLITIEVLKVIFVGSLVTVYKLIFEVMRFNKFCFFDLVGDGLLMKVTGISKK